MKIKVYSTHMGEREVESTAQTWGDLQLDLTKNNIKYDNMKAVIGETKLSMDSVTSQVPRENFTLFLMPMKTKSGK